jgi:hypothetical protein
MVILTFSTIIYSIVIVCLVKNDIFFAKCVYYVCVWHTFLYLVATGK